MPWKMDGETIVVQEGHPVWVYEDGKESPFNAESALKTIKDVTAESVGRKKKIQEFETQVKAFEGIEKPEEFVGKAKEALETVKNLDDKKLIEAGEVEKIKSSVSESFKAQIADMSKGHAEALQKVTDDLEAKDGRIRKMVVEGAFTRSGFLREKTVLLPDFAYNTFGRHFKVEEDGDNIKVSATDTNGNPIFSLKNPGQPADPEEAIEILVNSHPQKDSLLKGIDGGGGTPPDNGGGDFTGKTITREAWDKMDPVSQGKHIKDGGRVKD